MPGEHIAVCVDVGWGDCDPAGIVFYPRFFEWMDLTSHVLVRAMGIPREAMLPPTASVGGFPLVGAQAEFLLPVQMDDRLEVRTRVARVGRSSFSLRHEIARLGRDGQPEVLVARGREDRVFVGRDASGTLRSQALTPRMRAVLDRFGEA